MEVDENFLLFLFLFYKSVCCLLDLCVCVYVMCDSVKRIVLCKFALRGV